MRTYAPCRSLSDDEKKQTSPNRILCACQHSFGNTGRCPWRRLRWHTRCGFIPDGEGASIRRVTSDLGKCYERIPQVMRDNPEILNAIMRHPSVYNHRFDSRLFQELLRRFCYRETLRESARYAAKVWNERRDPNLWRQIPRALWEEDTELCLELLSWLPLLYGFLPNRLKSDPDVLAALLTNIPKNDDGFATLLGLLPVELQLQHPDLLLRFLKGCEGGGLVMHCRSESPGALAPDLWRNRDVVLALFRSGMVRRDQLRPPEGVLEHFENYCDMWMEVAKGPDSSLFKTHCPASLRSDLQFLRRAVRANHDVCLKCVTGDPPRRTLV